MCGVGYSNSGTMRRFSHCCAIASLLTAAALPAQRTDTTSAKASLMNADAALARIVASRGAGAILEAFASAAAIEFPGPQIFRDAVQARETYLARYSAPSTYTWRPVHAVVSSDGNFGCTAGLSEFVNGADTLHVKRPGTYVSCWRRGGDGAWRIVGHGRSEQASGAPIPAAGAVLKNPPQSALRNRAATQLSGAQDADAAFAALATEAAGAGPAFVKYAAEDAMLFSSVEPPSGKEGIAKAWEGASPDRVLLWGPERDIGFASGGLAFTMGNAVNKPREGKTGPESHSKYLTVWRLEADGNWRYIFDIGSARP